MKARARIHTDGSVTIQEQTLEGRWLAVTYALQDAVAQIDRAISKGMQVVEDAPRTVNTGFQPDIDAMNAQYERVDALRRRYTRAAEDVVNPERSDLMAEIKLELDIERERLGDYSTLLDILIEE